VHELRSFGAAAAHVMLSDSLQTYLLQQRGALLVELAAIELCLISETLQLLMQEPLGLRGKLRPGFGLGRIQSYRPP
jgi:hypothetical protein